MQSRFASLVEVTLNTLSGFVVSLLVSWLVYPLYGWQPSMGQMTQLTVIFTIVSIARSWLWRRYFNRLAMRKLIQKES